MIRLLTPELVAALKDYPLYSQENKGKEAICIAVLALGAIRWFILEGEINGDATTLYGIVVGLMEDEYGYISLKELSEQEWDGSKYGLENLQVRLQTNWQPTPLKFIRDHRLQRFLAKFEKFEEEKH